MRIKSTALASPSRPPLYVPTRASRSRKAGFSGRVRLLQTPLAKATRRPPEPERVSATWRDKLIKLAA
jgi:hypothetical protein